MNKYAVALVILTLIGTVSAVNLEYSRNLETGWNLVSLPYSSMGYDSSSECQFTRGYLYLPTNHSYIQFTPNVAPGVNGYNFFAFWMYSPVKCVAKWKTADATGQIPHITTSNLSTIWAAGGGAFNFKAGWNLISGFADNPTIANVTGECQIIRGPFTYNPVTAWRQSNTLSTGQGYFIKVASDCRFGYTTPTEQTPPAPPA